MSDAPKNQDIDRLYTAIGSAISNWTRVEIQLYQLFAISLSMTVMQNGGFSIASYTPNAVLDSIDSFRGKLLMIDAALSTALADLDKEATAILNDWAKERHKTNALHRNRSRLAHWSVATKFGFDKGVGGPVLVPPSYSSNGHQGITETDVRDWEKAFSEAANRLSALVARLASHRGLQHKFLRQVASQVRCTLPADATNLEFLKRELEVDPKP